MLDPQFIRDNPDLIRQTFQNKQLDESLLDKYLVADSQRREFITKIDKLRGEANQNADQIKKMVHEGGKPDIKLIANGKDIKEKLKKIEEEFEQVKIEFEQLAIAMPNPPAEDVPIGPDESGNRVVRTEGELPQFDFTPHSHQELMENLGILDIKKAVKIGGFRSYFLKGDGLLLERAILDYALNILISEGFTPMSAPSLVNSEAMVGTGYFPWGKEDHYFTQDGQILAGTAEVALTAYHQGETIRHKDLPIKMCGISPCFRREIGSYGKDTQGIIRVHQFNKVEMVVYTVADEKVTRDWHETMTALSERLLTDLNIPYQVLLMCTGDMGVGQRKKYDIESWFPAQNKYRETHSASYFNDFQSRRLNIRYQDKDGQLKFVYTLNNTMAASPRLLACLVENCQQKDGSIVVPEVLRKYMGKDKIIAS